jgi:nicotinate-nucleotide--dimethylbenzimidazole phosphoribosyltransferase
MPSGSTCIEPRSDRGFGVLVLADRLRGFAARLPRATPRAAASVTLLAVVASAALALMPQRAATTPPSTPGTSSHAVTVPAAPVKIVGATPRSDNCAEQVWPYIEHRCLTRAADHPKPPMQANAPALTEPQSDARATVGAAPAATDAALPQPPAAANEPATLPVPPGAAPPQPQAAANEPAKLPVPPGAAPPQPQAAANEPAKLPVPPGAAPLPPAPSAKHPSLAQEEVGLRPESVGEPRRRASRRAYRSRNARDWSRRPAFGFPF